LPITSAGENGNKSIFFSRWRLNLKVKKIFIPTGLNQYPTFALEPPNLLLLLFTCTVYSSLISQLAREKKFAKSKKMHFLTGGRDREKLSL
jgi:hypothetical protein